MVSISRIEPENSILQLVRAFSRSPRPYSLICIGHLDTRRNRYHRRIRDAASDQVQFPGAIYDKNTITSIRHHALAYLHGHTVGGTNPSLVEALGAGNAIVAHQNKFNLWTAGPDQFYFSTEDDCASIFHRLATDKKAVLRARTAAVQQHAAMFTWASVLGAYKSLCARAAKAPFVVLPLVVALLSALTQPCHANSKYRLGPGDKLEVRLAGSVAYRVAVNADGDIAIPQTGDVAVSGLSLSEAQLSLREKYRSMGISESADVPLEILEYRPFYIAGDVARPGAYAFQPNITVRKAVSLAGGLDMVRFRLGENPFLQSADVRSE